MATPRVRDWMTADPVMTRAGTSLATVRSAMQKADVHRLLVTDESGRLVGIVTWGDLTEAWPSRYSDLESYEIREQMARVEVDEIMTSPAIVVDPDATIAEAVNLMFENRIGALPVVETDQVVGILTSSDILQGLVRILTQHSVPGSVDRGPNPPGPQG